MTKNDDQELFDDLSRQSTPERTSAAAARLRRDCGRRSGVRLLCGRFVSMTSCRTIIASAWFGALSKGST